MDKLLGGLVIALYGAMFALFIGWCMNAYKLITSDFEAPWRPEIVRGISFIAAPVAGVVGWMNLEGEK